VHEIWDLRARILQENDVFELGKKSVSKVFLQEVLKLDKSTSFEDVELEYWKYNDIPEKTDNLWDFIAKEYLKLEKEPKYEFLKLSFKISSDLEKIADNLTYISEALEEIGKKKSLSATERYYKKQLDYFQKKNLKANDQIIKFMAKDIKSYVIGRAAPNILASFLFSQKSPYPYGRQILFLGRDLLAGRDLYDVRSLNEFSNKFMDLTVSSHEMVINECEKSPDKFKKNSLRVYKW